MYMILFEEHSVLPYGDMLHTVSAIRKVQNTDEAAREWQRVGDVYSAFMISDTPSWDLRLITHKDK